MSEPHLQEPPSSTRALSQIIQHLAHYLPAQAPLSVFVHHNTLHAFEQRPFERAVVEAAELLGCRPFLSEEEYRQELSRARILERDLHYVIEEDLGEKAHQRIAGVTSRFALRLAMLLHPLLQPRGAELEWVLAETDSLYRLRSDLTPEVRRRFLGRAWSIYGRDIPSEKLERMAVKALWDACERAVKDVPLEGPEPPRLLRRRDLLLSVANEDSDALVHPLLIRFLSAFLDQGVAYWSMPERTLGLYRCFLRLYSQPGGVLEPWTDGLLEEIAKEEGLTPEDSVLRSLSLLGVTPEEQEDFLREMLLALRGWTGMIHQVEERPDRFFDHVPNASLIEYLAVRLLLERLALSYVAKKKLGYRGPLCDLRAYLQERLPKAPQKTRREVADLLFQLSQLLGISAEQVGWLSLHQVQELIREAEAFAEIERRRLFHLAYERRHLVEVLDALLAHSKAGPTQRAESKKSEEKGEAEPKGPPKRARLFDWIKPKTKPIAPEAKPAPSPSVLRRAPYAVRPSSSASLSARTCSFQAVFCIDEREESMRRHLEEVDPACETFGVAGFFGVAMYYRGTEDAHPRALCPINIRPVHEVEELREDETSVQRLRVNSRRFFGRVARAWMVGNRTFTRGTMITALLGAVAALPLVSRVLFPRLTARLSRQTSRLMRPAARTYLAIERRPQKPILGKLAGFTKEEMAEIVARVLTDIGLLQNIAPLVFIVGHGSTSLNNPHESAYDCGACGGGRGGPNARAFAQMANDPEVRELLEKRGTHIPENTWFLGAYHSTSDDAFEIFDLDLLPAHAKEPFLHAREAFEQARMYNAHERCRRFEAAPVWFPPSLALSHVEARAADLAQPRPECGHATNAVCIIGRRQRTYGLFLDRRAFLVSYDPTQDDEEGTILGRILAAVAPVGAGINLEYFFSYVDSLGYGCGTKLPHNITGLIGVMDGHLSDLRTGLPWQMVEIHEPVRLLVIVEATVERLQKVVSRSESLSRLVQNRWIRAATLHPSLPQLSVLGKDGFSPYTPESTLLLSVPSSVDWYRGRREHLPCARISQDAVSERRFFE